MYMYRSILFLFLLNIVQRISSDECEPIEKNEQVSEEKRLKEDLLCNYNKNFVPLKNSSDEMKISVKMNVTNYSVSSHSDSKSMYVLSEMEIKWQDDFLTWNPEDYNSISEIVMSTSNIWSPEIMPEVRDFFSREHSLLSSTDCKLVSSGLVTCEVESSHEGFCTGDEHYWPYDEYMCALQYMVLTYNNEPVLIDFPNVENNTFILGEQRPSDEWKILDKLSGYYSSKPQEGMMISEMDFDFHLKRNIGNRIPFIFLTMAILSIFTLMCFWTNFESSDRVILCLANIICHIWDMQNLEWQINMRMGHTVPYVLCYYRDSLVLAFFCLVETMIFKKILQSQKPTPSLLVTLDNIAGRVFIKKMLFVEGKISSEQKNEEQGSFEEELQFIKQSNQMEKRRIIQVFDRLCFVGYFISYFIMGIGILTLNRNAE